MQGHASEMFQNEEDVVHAGKEGEQSAQGKRVVTSYIYSYIFSHFKYIIMLKIVCFLHGLFYSSSGIGIITMGFNCTHEYGVCMVMV